jgi:cytochrome c551/c552
MREFKLLVLLGLLFGLAACGSGTASESGTGAGAGDPEAGEALYAQQLIGTQPGCMTCHSLEPDVVMVGPSLSTIGSVAGSRVSGLSAEEYLRQSILEPDAYLVEGFGAGLMPASLAGELTEQQVSDIVAYMLLLR